MDKKAIRILYAEDEPGIGQIVKDGLELMGYDVVWALDGLTAKQSFAVQQPDICILDVMMPKMDGFELGKHIHSLQPQLPIIFLTARDQTEDVLEGFSSGGNDYIRKPFSMKELEVRINNLLQLQAQPGQTNTPETFTIGAFHFNTISYELKHHDISKKLTHKEAALLTMLAGSANQAVERKHILLNIWDDDSFFHSRSLDVYIKKLRNYLAVDPSVEIVTLKGIGYRLVTI
ncbi:MAG: response regulator transcription factor [Saprospiraceae bacterium]|nr:response regulator transcription factor [Saprospiraceae bacterium]